MTNQQELFPEAPAKLLPRLIYLVIINDRHAEPEAIPFYNKDEAIEYARSYVISTNSHHGDIEEGLTESMKKAGWLYYCLYSCESDSVWVIEEKIR
jgi:hypothetical protein